MIGAPPVPSHQASADLDGGDRDERRLSDGVEDSLRVQAQCVLGARVGDALEVGTGAEESRVGGGEDEGLPNDNDGNQAANWLGGTVHWGSHRGRVCVWVGVSLGALHQGQLSPGRLAAP